MERLDKFDKPNRKPNFTLSDSVDIDKLFRDGGTYRLDEGVDFEETPMMPVETETPWPQAFHRRITTAKAMKVTATNLPQAADWCGGHLWPSSVVVPILMSNGRTGEMTAAPGDWIVEIADHFQVWPGDRFRMEWEAAR